MKLTYDDILNSMKLAFYEKTGENVDLLGDIGARFQAVASELLSIACNAEFNLKQSFPQTATGEYLDRHSQLRGITRKQGSRARVVLSFSIPEVSDSDISVPAKTICACRERPYIQFETLEGAVIPSGELSVDALAEAIAEGDEYNVKTGEVTVMVNPPTGVSRVENLHSATGGSNYESDDRLRRRVVNAFSVPATGLNVTSLAGVVEAIDEVMQCRIYQVVGGLNIYIRTADNEMSSTLLGKVKSACSAAKLIDLKLSVRQAVPKSIDISAKCRLNRNAPSGTMSKIKELIKNEIDASAIGDNVELGALAMKCMLIEGVEQIKLSTSLSENGIISLSTEEYPVLSSLEVTAI